jgi:hypothetical protein
MAFVSSSSHYGDALDGLTGADTICQRLATAAGLPGTYLAWISDNTASPSTRFIQATVPYMMPDGTVIATSYQDRTDGTLAHAIDRTESGGTRTSVVQQAWTNTLSDGSAAGLSPANSHCGNWHVGTFGNTGSTLVADGGWTAIGNHPCEDAPRGVYCFQQR